LTVEGIGLKVIHAGKHQDRITADALAAGHDAAVQMIDTSAARL
jgi:hypothetical protein